MIRKRLTQAFPILLPARKWERKKMFYLKMKLDGNHYAKTISEEMFPNTVFEEMMLLINENSKFDIQYQINKVHNLKLAAKTVNKIIIKPNETFSFWQLVRYADSYEKYKDALNVVNGEIVGSYGGGLCQFSGMLYWLFLHTPLTIVERKGHSVEYFPSSDEEIVYGTDATVDEGWLDLKVRNDTDNIFQIEISFDEMFMYGRILSKNPVDEDYRVYNSKISYIEESGKLYQIASVCRSEKEIKSDKRVDKELYINQCEIAYDIKKDIKIERRGA